MNKCRKGIQQNSILINDKIPNMLGIEGNFLILKKGIEPLSNFPLKSKISQGCPFSPLLFTVSPGSPS